MSSCSFFLLVKTFVLCSLLSCPTSFPRCTSSQSQRAWNRLTNFTSKRFLFLLSNMDIVLYQLYLLLYGWLLTGIIYLYVQIPKLINQKLGIAVRLKIKVAMMYQENAVWPHSIRILQRRYFFQRNGLTSSQVIEWGLLLLP